VKLTEFSLRNPLYVGLIAICLAIVGVYAYLTLSISIVPNITQASAIVSTTDPGADPATIETQITRPIEDAIATVQNVKTLTSSSSQGLSVVTVGFATNVNADLVTIDVERASTRCAVRCRRRQTSRRSESWIPIGAKIK